MENSYNNLLDDPPSCLRVAYVACAMADTSTLPVLKFVEQGEQGAAGAHGADCFQLMPAAAGIGRLDETEHCS